MKVIRLIQANKEEFKSKVYLMKKVNIISSPHMFKYITSFVNENEQEYKIIIEYSCGRSLLDIIKDYTNKEKRNPE